MGNQCGGACGGQTPEEGEILMVFYICLMNILRITRKEALRKCNHSKQLQNQSHLKRNWNCLKSMRTKLLGSSLMLEATRQESKSVLANTIKVNTHINQIIYVDVLLKEEGLEFREEVVYHDGAVYKGQLKVGTDIRHGFGIQVWPDGAKYEGNWRENVASGRGKFYHIDGDVYDGKQSCTLLINYLGNWDNDKANGYGVYLHSNGSKYEGDWKDDK